jgi:hypothetical protein
MLVSVQYLFEQEVGVEFQDWLISEGLSISTAKKYAGALRGSLTTWGKQNKILTGSLANIRDPGEFGIVSGLIKATDIFSERNTRGNHMYGATLSNYSRYLNEDSKIVQRRSPNSGPFRRELTKIQRDCWDDAPFQPDNQNDARQWVLKEVVHRQGQPKFRSNLITAYEGRCAITKCSLLMILDAAHVTPYLGEHTNLISNGILLRTDLHALWDQGLIAIDPTTMLTSIYPGLDDPSYQALHNLPIFQPTLLSSRLSQQALVEQWQIYQENFHR